MISKYSTPSLQKDIAFGLSSEAQIILKLREFFKEDIIKSTSDFCIYDAKCKDTNTFYEIKTRRCKLNEYKTTIIPITKIDIYDGKNTLYFVFSFTDGIFYIKYEKMLFETFERDFFTYYRNGVIVKPVEHICIPCKYLTFLEEK